MKESTRTMKECLNYYYDGMTLNIVKAIESSKNHTLEMLNRISEQAMKYFGKTDYFKTNNAILNTEYAGQYDFYVYGIVGEKREFGIDAMSVYGYVFFDPEFFALEQTTLEEVKDYAIKFRFTIFRKYRPKTEKEFLEDPDYQGWDQDDYHDDFGEWDQPATIREDSPLEYVIMYSPYWDEITHVDTLSDEDIKAPNEPEYIQQFYRMFKDFINSFSESEEKQD
jgi:hypothetical protein